MSKTRFYCQESEVHFSFFLLQLPHSWSIRMQNSRAAPASLPCSLQIKSLEKGLCTLRFVMCEHSPGCGGAGPGRIKAALGGKARTEVTEPGLQLCLGSAAPQKMPFLSRILYKQSCSSLRASNATAAGDKLKEEISSQPLM